MTVHVAINGFGRIGRNILRPIIENGRNDIEVVAVNDLGPVETNAHLLRYDSVHGRFPGEVKVEGDAISVGKRKFKVTAIKDPSTLPWKDLGVDIALECTGIFNSKDKASAHLTAGAKAVLVSAPADGADVTVVYGVNHDRLSKEHKVVSNASCTTNCLAPVAKVLNDAIGIEKGFMTTIHAYTGDQPTLDTLHKDLYRARAAAMSLIPTSTGAAKAVGLVLPELNGKLDGVAIRAPVPNVSVVDFKFVAKRTTSKDEVNAAIKRAADQQLKGIKEIAMRRRRRAKIVATVGPASASPAMLKALFLAGVDTFRLNFSHGTHDDHANVHAAIRALERSVQQPIGILMDLQGPKIRVGTLRDNKIAVRAGESIRFVLSGSEGDHSAIPLPHPEIFAAIAPGHDLLIDDGRERVRPTSLGNDKIEAKDVISAANFHHA